MFADCSSSSGSSGLNKSAGNSNSSVCGYVACRSTANDALTLTKATTSAWCAMMPSSSRIRVLRLMRPQRLRRILVTSPNLTTPTFGFMVRGGKEYGTGFFVSSVEYASEAELRGLRIGDQILCVNGFRVDDAVHREFVQFVSSQDRLTLKVRSVGMLPMKEQSNALTWQVLSANTALSESFYDSSNSTTSTLTSTTTTIERDMPRRRCRELRVVLNVAPRTKLGLGICKGPDWKPGIFVQFTKDGSVAREAGLRQGDQILSVNSIDFADVLFSEAVAVMKNANQLEMLVRTAAGCDLFPGESSGYNSSASSVTGDQSPCWADVKSKRLTAVRENEENTVSSIASNNVTSGTTKVSVLKMETETVRQMNKTIIKLSESGTSINNTYIANKNASVSEMSNNAMVPPPPPPQILANDSNASSKSLDSNKKSSSNNTYNNQYSTPGTSLCSAITEELKKRKEKQNNFSMDTLTKSINDDNKTLSDQKNQNQYYPKSSQQQQLNTSNEFLSQRRQQVFKPRDRHASNDGNGSSKINGKNGNNVDQHNALMDEFMNFHQRMFRNGFHETEQEREEALKYTNLMADQLSYRNDNDNKKSGIEATYGNVKNQNENTVTDVSSIPPPPAKFANTSTATDDKPTSVNKSPSLITPLSEDNNVELRSNTSLSGGGGVGVGATVNKIGSRLSNITIGQYEQQRRKSVKLDFLPPPTLSVNTPSLQAELQNTLLRSKLKPSTMEHKKNCPMLVNRQQSIYSNSSVSGNGSTGNPGILKNGHRHSSASSSSERTLTFGN